MSVVKIQLYISDTWTGNALKWDTTEPTQNTFAFTHGDYEVQWAKNHSQIVRGHNFGEHSVGML